MGFDPIVGNALIYLRCYNAVRVELTTRTAHVATTLVCHLSLVLDCSQNAGFLEVLPDILQRRTDRVNYTDRSCCNTNDSHYVTGGGGEPTGAGHDPSREGGELWKG